MTIDVNQIGSRVAAESQLLSDIRLAVSRVSVGQESLVSRLLSALSTGNHVLIEGVPGLAKTLTVTTLAQAMDAVFHRIQFTLH